MLHSYFPSSYPRSFFCFGMPHDICFLRFLRMGLLLRMTLFWMTVNILKNTGQFFCGISQSGICLIIRLELWILRRRPWRYSAVSSNQGTADLSISIGIDISYLAEAVFVIFLHFIVTLPFFHTSLFGGSCLYRIHLRNRQSQTSKTIKVMQNNVHRKNAYIYIS